MAKKILGGREKHEIKEREVRCLIVRSSSFFKVAGACYRLRYVQ